jgi:hypothetical protein
MAVENKQPKTISDQEVTRITDLSKMKDRASADTRQRIKEVEAEVKSTYGDPRKTA